MTVDADDFDVATTPEGLFFRTRILPHTGFLEDQLTERLTLDQGTYAYVTVPSGELLEHLRALARHIRIQELVAARRHHGWIVENEDLMSALPPDLTRGWWPEMCNARLGQDWTCTRRAAHTGRHAAGTGVRIVAVWGDHQCPEI